jgi:hypothetical protein
MKTIVLSIFFVALLNLKVNSQSGCTNFDKYYDYSLYQENLDVAFLSTGGYLTFGGKAYDSLGLSVTSTFINRLDINGDTVWTRSLGGNDETNFYTKTGAFPGVWFRQGEVLQDSIIIACGSYQDSTCFDQFHYYGQVVRYNLNGDTVWTRKLALQDTSVGMYGMLAYDDSTYIITGDYRPFNISNPLLLISVLVLQVNSFPIFVLAPLKLNKVTGVVFVINNVTELETNPQVALFASSVRSTEPANTSLALGV